MSDNLLIVGGSGFVSGTVARRAVASGWRVWAVTRGRLPPDGVIAIVADRKDTLVFISTDFVFDPAHRAFPQGEVSEHYLSDG